MDKLIKKILYIYNAYCSALTKKGPGLGGSAGWSGVQNVAGFYSGSGLVCEATVGISLSVAVSVSVSLLPFLFP